MRLLTKVSVIFICYLVFIISVYGTSHYLTITSSGNVNVPAQLTTDTPHIDWGNVSLGTPVLRSIKLTNVGDEALTSLNMTSSSIQLTNYTLTWNAPEKINPKEELTVVFTLTVYNYTSVNFEVTINISGEP